MSKVWIITGAGRGMGLNIAKAALAAGHKVVATGRNTEKVAQAIGEAENLLVAKLDVTKHIHTSRYYSQLMTLPWRSSTCRKTN